MKHKKRIGSVVTYLATGLMIAYLACSCDRSFVQTGRTSDVGARSAYVFGSVNTKKIDPSDSTIEVGVEVDTLATLNTARKFPARLDEDGTFRARVYGLRPTRTYYYRTYAKVSASLIQCGEILSFTAANAILPELNGYEAVDLALPSGLLWATHNVGANEVEEFGELYAWGEIYGISEGKKAYRSSDYKFSSGRYTVSKYCTKEDHGTVDGKTVLEPEDDVAHVKWGGDWRMPSEEEWQELNDYCTWEWTNVEDVSGYLVRGRNGNVIFLPAAGYRSNKGYIYPGTIGYYWANSLAEDESYYAEYLFFSDEKVEIFENYRYYGLAVRPVCSFGE